MERNKALTFQVTEEEKRAIITWQAEQTVKRGHTVTREEAIRELIARGLAARPRTKAEVVDDPEQAARKITNGWC